MLKNAREEGLVLICKDLEAKRKDDLVFGDYDACQSFVPLEKN